MGYFIDNDGRYYEGDQLDPSHQPVPRRPGPDYNFVGGVWVIAMELVRSTKLTQMEVAYAAAIQQPVSYMGTTFQSDTESQSILTSTLVALNAAGAVPPGFGWWDINNIKVPMTLPELNGLAGAMLAQGWEAFQNKQAKKDAARAATTIDQVNSVIW